MAIQIEGFTIANVAEVDATSKALRTSLYDAAGNVMAAKSGAAAGTNQGYFPVAGLDGGSVLRPIRVDEFSTTRTTSEILLWHDGFEQTTINSFWTQSVVTQTIAQSAANVLTLNNSGITTLNTDSIITSQRQFPKYTRQPLWCRFRANISANVAGNHTLVEMGLGAPTGVTAIISNGAFFRWRVDGTLAVVISYNGTEQVTQVLAQGVISTTAYYLYDVIVEDGFVRFFVTDTSGVPIVDQQVALTTTVPYTFAVSHIPSFARVYVDATGGGTVVKLNLSAHTVQLLDALNNMTWADQSAAAMRNSINNPVTWAQNTQLTAGTAPGVLTPSNTVAGNAFLGGEAQIQNTASSENLLSIFAFAIPTSQHTLFLKRLYIPRAIITTALGATAQIVEWFFVANCASGNINTGGGQRYALGLHTAASAAAAGTVMSGDAILWQPDTPICCVPGTTLHIGWKVISGSVTGVFRVVIGADGYWM